MKLNSKAQAILDAAKATGAKPVYFFPVEEARAKMEDLFRNPDSPELLESVEDVIVPSPISGMRLRIYRPCKKRDIGCLVFIHGGGWTLNSVDTHDFVCRRISKRANCIVISVDHRMAPEYKYPAALEDVFTALQWAFNNGDQYGWDVTKIAIGGDSSGGTLATTAAMLNRDRSGPQIAAQVLIYPVTDYFLPGTASYTDRATGYSLNKDFMVWFWNNYLPSKVNLNDPYLCPLRAPDLSQMPPSLIITAEFDPLRDEGQEYVKKLKAAGSEVTHLHLDDQMHGFIMLTRIIDRANETLENICDFLRVKIGEK